MSYRVLIADDETFVRNLLKKNLQASELPIKVVAVAEDGQEALEMVREFRPDIVITDIEMPFMNGLELIRALQEQDIKTKNIIISGYDEFDYAKTAISLGVTDYLLKPLMPEELLGTFEKIIRELDSQNTLKQNLQLLRQQADKYKVVSRKAIIKSLLEGNTVSTEELEMLGFTYKPQSWFVTCIIRVNSVVWNFEAQEQTEEFLKLIRTDYFSDLLHFYGLGLNGDTIALCFQVTDVQEAELLDEVARGMEKLSHSMKQYYDIVLDCSVGRGCRNPSMLKDSYEDACCGIVSRNLSANRAESAVRLVQNYVEDHLRDRTLSIERVGEMVHFSVSYLRQIFKEVTGESFNEYLIRKRMERAGQLLRDTSMKIQDISESCGYENQRYFASSFKKFFGCTPTEYKTILSRKET